MKYLKQLKHHANRAEQFTSTEPETECHKWKLSTMEGTVGTIKEAVKEIHGAEEAHKTLTDMFKDTLDKFVKSARCKPGVERSGQRWWRGCKCLG